MAESFYNKMRVLVACEFSGTVRDAFSALGHYALSCDLLDTEREGPHHTGDVRDVLHEPWDLLIAHPPCTYLSSSGLHWNARGAMVNGRPRADMTEEAVEFARLLIDADHIPHRCVENPIGCLSTRIRKPEQIIQPWQFGEDASKSTCLWLHGLPPLVPTKVVPPRYVCCGEVLDVDTLGMRGCPTCYGQHKAKPRWANQTDSGQNRLGPSPDRWAKRSKTYSGIANAMATQWSEHIAQA